ncbi:MAG: radical SAM protein [Lachnospiraceae bacterium]|nr:radical SAM protein [Lachnospiraceae bacterium]
MERDLYKEYEECILCARKCRVNRYEKTGYCKSGADMRIARAALHMWEEPCISGTKGSGAVFFTGCNMGCVFCQNHMISSGGIGKEVSEGRLAEIFYELADKGANNINLVTGDIYLPGIKTAMKRVKERGFKLPFILNTSSYLNVESIRSLEGLIDIYLPDFKYIRDEDAKRLSNAPGYPKAAKAAVDEMVRQCPECIFDETDNGSILKRGVIVRHLLMPGMLIQAKLIVKYLHDRYGDKVILSLLDQYTPNGRLESFPEINRPVSETEYNSLIRYAQSLGVKGYMQEKGSADDGFIPEFDLSGV